MAARFRSESRARLLLCIAIATLALGVGSAPASTVAATNLSAWTGSVDLYRAATFTTQKSWLWCTAADVQIMNNIVDRAADHSKAAQERYFDWMRDHNRYAIPAADGVDPVGWTAGLREFVDDRYRLTQSRSFDAALRSAVTSLRRTNLPVGITVGHGSHAWVLTGFSASADPAATTRFTVSRVRVVGPLWGLQSRSYGYDMRPGTSLTPKQLAGFFTPWHYAGIRMAWESRWVSVQPTGAASTGAIPPTPTPATMPPPLSTSTPTSRSASTEPSAATEPSAEPTPLAVANPPQPAASAGHDLTRGTASSVSVTPPVALVVAAAVASVVLGIGVIRVRSRRPT